MIIGWLFYFYLKDFVNVNGFSAFIVHHILIYAILMQILSHGYDCYEYFTLPIEGVRASFIAGAVGQIQSSSIFINYAAHIILN